MVTKPQFSGFRFFLNLLFLFWVATGISVAQEAWLEMDYEQREKAMELTRKAVRELEEKNTEKAIELLEGAIYLDSTFHQAYTFLYRAYMDTDKNKQHLVPFLVKAKKLFREDDELAFYLGNVYQIQQKFDHAIQEYNQAIAYSKINGEDFPIVYAYYFNRGNCYLKIKKYKEAIADYNYTLTLNPGDPGTLTNRGFCFYKTGENEMACADWQDALESGMLDTQRYLKAFCE